LPFDTAKAKRATAVLDKNGTYMVPTRTALRGISYTTNSPKQLPKLAYVDPAYLMLWQTRYVTIPPNAVATTLRNLSLLHQQGIMILAGTDEENLYTVLFFYYQHAFPTCFYFIKCKQALTVPH